MKNSMSIPLLSLLAFVGCYTDGCDTPSAPSTTATAELTASFQGTFTPTAVADDGVCRLVLTATTSGGTRPYIHTFDAGGVQDAANSALNYPSGPRVTFTLPATFGAPPLTYLIGLTSTDTAGVIDDAAAVESLNCATHEGSTFFGS